MTKSYAYMLAVLCLVASTTSSFAFLDLSTGPQVSLRGVMNGVPIALELENGGNLVRANIIATEVPPEFSETRLAEGKVQVLKFTVDAKAFSIGMPPQEVSVTYWLPECDWPAGGKGIVTLEGTTFTLSAKSLELHPVACKEVTKREYSLKTQFTGFGEEQRQAMGLIDADAYASCDLRSLAPREKADFVGLKARIYGGGTIGFMDPLARTEPFWGMGFSGRVQTGDARWDVSQNVLWYGDEVEILDVTLWNPGMHYMDTKWVQVRRISDGLTTIVSGFNLFTGDIEACDPKVLMMEEILSGIWIKVHEDVTLNSPTGRWINDPDLKYGYCIDARTLTLECQTRAYTGDSDHYDNFSIKWSDFDLVTSVPPLEDE